MEKDLGKRVWKLCRPITLIYTGFIVMTSRKQPGEVVEMMNEWISSGENRYYGVSNWKTERIREAECICGSSWTLWNFCIPDSVWIRACATPIPGEILRLSAWMRGNIGNIRNCRFLYAYSAQAEGYFQPILKGGSGGFKR